MLLYLKQPYFLSQFIEFYKAELLVTTIILSFNIYLVYGRLKIFDFQTSLKQNVHVAIFIIDGNIRCIFNYGS